MNALQAYEENLKIFNLVYYATTGAPADQERAKALLRNRYQSRAAGLPARAIPVNSDQHKSNPRRGAQQKAARDQFSPLAPGNGKGVDYEANEGTSRNQVKRKCATEKLKPASAVSTGCRVELGEDAPSVRKGGGDPPPGQSRSGELGHGTPPAPVEH